MNSLVRDAIDVFASSSTGRHLEIRHDRELQYFALSSLSSEYGLLTVVALRATGDPFVVRIARRKSSVHLQHERELLDEAHHMLQSRLSATIPRALYLGQIAGHPFLVTTFVPGEPLRSRLRGPARLRRNAIIKAVASSLTSIGQQTKRPMPRAEHASLAETAERATASGDVDDDLQTRVAWAAAVLSDAPEVPCVLQHGDMHAGNVLVTRWGAVSGIVDWVDAVAERSQRRTGFFGCLSGCPSSLFRP